MNWLNYHHLYYFWVTAQEMSVTRAARRLRLSQSTVSGQIRELEEMFGHPLFERVKKRLRLTESGKLAREYANTIFTTGQELVDVFQNRTVDRKIQNLRIGAISHLSKNLQMEFVSSALVQPEVRILMTEGPLGELCQGLRRYALDLVLSDSPARIEDGGEVFNHALGEMPVFLVGSPAISNRAISLKKALSFPLFLPTPSSRLRSEFEALLESLKLRAEIKAEVEDMALLRLFALSGRGLALVPEIVVRNELKSGQLKRLVSLPRLRERFFAITASRKFPNPWVEKMVREFSRRLK